MDIYLLKVNPESCPGGISRPKKPEDWEQLPFELPPLASMNGDTPHPPIAGDQVEIWVNEEPRDRRIVVGQGYTGRANVARVQDKSMWVEGVELSKPPLQGARILPRGGKVLAWIGSHRHPRLVLMRDDEAKDLKDAVAREHSKLAALVAQYQSASISTDEPLDFASLDPGQTTSAEISKDVDEGDRGGKTSAQLVKGEIYTRERLRQMFDISDATINNGIFKPKGYSSVWLFVTEEKTSDRTQYQDRLDGDTLYMQGQNAGRTDRLITDHEVNGIELLAFFRHSRHEHAGAGFRYLGPFVYLSHSGAVPVNFVLERLDGSRLPADISSVEQFDPSSDRWPRAYSTFYRCPKRSTGFSGCTAKRLWRPLRDLKL